MCGYLDDLQLFFCVGCSWVPCLFWTVELSTVLQTNPPRPADSLVFQHLLHIWTLSSSDCMILRSIFSHRGQLRDSNTTIKKVQTFTDAPEGCKYLLLLPKGSTKWKNIYFNKIRTIWTSSSCSKVLIFDLSYFVKMIHIFRFCKGFPNFRMQLYTCWFCSYCFCHIMFVLMFLINLMHPCWIKVFLYFKQKGM